MFSSFCVLFFTNVSLLSKIIPEIILAIPKIRGENENYFSSTDIKDIKCTKHIELVVPYTTFMLSMLFIFITLVSYYWLLNKMEHSSRNINSAIRTKVKLRYQIGLASICMILTISLTVSQYMFCVADSFRTKDIINAIETWSVNCLHVTLGIAMLLISSNLDYILKKWGFLDVHLESVL